MNAVIIGPLGSRTWCWLLLGAALLATALVQVSRPVAAAALPEYELRLLAAPERPAPWLSTTLAAVRLPRDGALNIWLHPVTPVSGPVALRLFAQNRHGNMEELRLATAPEIHADGNIWLHASLPRDTAPRHEITFLITRPGADVSVDALRRASPNQRLLHVSVTHSAL